MADLLNVHPIVLERWFALERAIRRAGYTVTVTSGFRSRAQQQKLYEARQRGEHPFPVARPGCSEHNHGVAVDAVTSVPERFLGGAARHFGLVWAGPTDRVHFGVFTQPQWRAVVHEEGLC